MTSPKVRLVSVSIADNGALFAVDADGSLWIHDRYAGWRTLEGPTLFDREKTVQGRNESKGDG
jgi:hypothetical protein